MAREKQVSFPVTEDEHERLKTAASARRLKMKELVLQAVGAFLAEPLPVAGPSPTIAPNEVAFVCRKKNAPWHAKLEEILVRGTPRNRVGIEENLNWATRGLAGEPGPPAKKEGASQSG